jgi:hypothetical protein
MQSANHVTSMRAEAGNSRVFTVLFSVTVLSSHAGAMYTENNLERCRGEVYSHNAVAALAHNLALD